MEKKELYRYQNWKEKEIYSAITVGLMIPLPNFPMLYVESTKELSLWLVGWKYQILEYNGKEAELILEWREFSELL